jgi:hypothetical protein
MPLAALAADGTSSVQLALRPTSKAKTLLVFSQRSLRLKPSLVTHGIAKWSSLADATGVAVRGGPGFVFGLRRSPLPL